VVLAAFLGLFLAVSGEQAAVAGAEPATPAFSPAHVDAQGIRVHRVQSEYQGAATEIRVLLPDRLEPGKRYPVLYVLPVEALREDRYGDGLDECRRLDLADKYGLICVAPTFSHLPWYADHPADPRIRQEAYFLKVVLPLVESEYPAMAQRDGRLLVGFSKSGWGAFSLLLRHPETFGRAAAWDAPLMMESPGKYGSGAIFGTQENFERYRLTRLLSEKSASLRGPPRLIHLGYGNFREHHEAADRLMRELGIPRVYRDGPKRPHTWNSGWLEEAVALLVQPGN
jgi:S-formylglutathione hydrolase FrmB